VRPTRPGEGGGGVQRPDLRPTRPGEGGSGTLKPGIGLLPSRPGEGGGGIQRPFPDRPDLRPTRPGQGGSGEQWRPDRPLGPDRPDLRPTRPGQGGGGEQWRPDRPINPDRPIRPDRPGIINTGNMNVGNRPIQNNFNNVNVNQWNQYNQSYSAANFNRPWYGQGAYFNQPFYGGLPAWNWSRPWFNYHYGWHTGYWSGMFSAMPALWSGYATGAVAEPAPTFAYANPYYEAPPPAAPSETTIVIQAPNYAQPIPGPSIEQTVIAYPQGPDEQTVKTDGAALPTTAPPAPPEDDVATAANKIFDEARTLFKSGKYADAQTKVEQAIEKLPSDATLHEFRSLTLFAQGKYKDAAAGLYAVLAAGPGWNWQTMQGLYGDVADYTKQFRALEEFVKANPDAGYGHFNMAYQNLVLGNKDAAVKELQEVVRVQPEDKLSAELVKALTAPPKNGAAGSASGQ